MDTFKRLLRLAKPYKLRLAIAMICMMLAGAAQSSIALLFKPLLDGLFLKKDTYALDPNTLKWVLPIAVVVIFFLKAACNYSQTVIMSFIGLKIVADLRNKLYQQIQKQSLSFFTQHPTGLLMSRITNDVNSIQSASSEAVTSLIRDTFTLIFLVCIIFYTDWKLAFISLIVFPLTIYPISTFGKKIRKVTTSSQITMGTLTTLLQETISGTRIVKAFSMEKYENKRFAAENELLLKLSFKVVTVNAISSPLMDFLAGLGIAAIIVYAGYQIGHGYSTPGTFASFLTAALMLYEPVKRLTNVNNTIQQGIAGAERVFSIIDRVPDIIDKPNAITLPPITRGIDIKNVTFRYEETPVLKNINLSIKAGEVVAFVGVSGGGKTSLVNLIPRFYDVTEGCILIDGHDIRDVTMQSLRNQIAIVTQQTILFNDTVKNNIAYGDIDRTEGDIISAAKAANAHDFIMKLPQGYDSNIGELGTKLSGGEKQRISIARALLKNAPILILDEATSSLDSEAEIEVQEALDNLMKGRTTLVIAHRLSTIRNADRIIVLVNGKIIEEGSHETLLTKKGEYFRLYNLQFKDEGNNVENEQLAKDLG
jgi:subfamily B ATP-binding cassette protein MsbA